MATLVNNYIFKALDAYPYDLEETVEAFEGKTKPYDHFYPCSFSVQTVFSFLDFASISFWIK